MAWMICGTVPDGVFSPDGGTLASGWRLPPCRRAGASPRLSVQRGTPAPARNRIADVRNAWGGASHGTARPGTPGTATGAGSSTAALRPPPACPGFGASRFITCSPTLMGTTAS